MSQGYTVRTWVKWGVLVAVGVAFLVPLVVALRFGSLWQIYQGYVDTVSNLTGLNNYLVSAASALLFIPFSMGVSMSLSWNSTRRRKGEAILLGLFVMYNLGLFAGTQHAYFGFTKGETLKWYAMTPDGVQLYDRAGVDPKYGIELKPVTKDIVRQLEVLQRGEFRPINPATATLFNPITGEAQAWFYRYPDGGLEFYDKPGFHPATGTPLQPVTQDAYFEWNKAKAEKERQAQQDEASNRHGWRVEGTSLVADLKPGEETAQTFTLGEGFSTPWLVLPPDYYSFRADYQDPVIREEEGGKKTYIGANESHNLGTITGTKRFRYTATKDGTKIIITVRRNANRP